MSSLRRGHANLLCIVPTSVYVLPKRALKYNIYTKLSHSNNTEEQQSLLIIILKFLSNSDCFHLKILFKIEACGLFNLLVMSRMNKHMYNKFIVQKEMKTFRNIYLYNNLKLL